MRLRRFFPNRLREPLPALLLVLLGTLLSGGLLAGADSGITTKANKQAAAASKAPSAALAKSNSQLTPPGATNSLGHSNVERPTLAGLRDPFRTNARLRSASLAPVVKPERLPGVAGLVIGELQLRGLVEERTTHRMVAVVTNGGTLSYFLHDQDQLYDGMVTQISPSALYLTRKALPSGANPSKGSVVLRLQAEPGDKP